MRGTFSVVLLVVLAALAPAADRPPNILMIYADDLGWGDVGCNGRTEWKTPHIDQLAKDGVLCQRWYSAATVCAPSRAALLTGKYGIHNGVVANADDLPRAQVTIAEALKDRGYRTALFGKWHHGRTRPDEKDYVHPMDQGFDEFMGYTDARHAWEHFPKELWFGREKKPVKGYASAMIVDRGIEFIKQNKDKPFFLYASFIDPHLIIEAPEEDVAPFKGKFKEKDASKPIYATYAAMISRLDKEIGRLLKAVDDQGLAKETLIVFSSDNGATFEVGNQGASNFHDSNRPLRGHKRNLWEGGIRVPGIVRWTGRIPAGKISTDPVHMTDLFPTFLAAAGGKLDPAWKVDGQNLLPVWMGKEKMPERTLFWEWRSEGYHQLAAMRGNLKLVVTGSNRGEFFDVAKDPSERRPINAEHTDTVKRLEGELKEWLATETEEAKWGKKGK